MYKSPSKDLWKGRANHLDGEDGYLFHHIIQLLDLSKEVSKAKPNSFAFLGFECEEGVRRNMGRLGAKGGPDSLRASLAKLSVQFDNNEAHLFDAGQVICSGSDLEGAQERLSEKVKTLLQYGYKPILLGGGHEIAYAHYEGIRRFVDGQGSTGIVNLDAHFDYRSYQEGPSSGTPFKQIHDENKSRNESFQYLPIGINRASNTKSLFKGMDAAGTSYLTVNDFDFSDSGKLTQEISKFIEGVDHLYLTLDLDVLSAAHAPGVSAPAGFGLSPDVIRHCMLECLKSGKLLSWDIAELNPKYDLDNRTARLAAYFVYEMIMNGLDA
jgi:formiminoglutamase